MLGPEHALLHPKHLALDPLSLGVFALLCEGPSQIARTGQLFPAYGLSQEQEDEIIDFMIDNAKHLREISLRMAIKLADLRRLSETRWKSIAANTCMKHA